MTSHGRSNQVRAVAWSDQASRQLLVQETRCIMSAACGAGGEGGPRNGSAALLRMSACRRATSALAAAIWAPATSPECAGSEARRSRSASTVSRMAGRRVLMVVCANDPASCPASGGWGGKGSCSSWAAMLPLTAAGVRAAALWLGAACCRRRSMGGGGWGGGGVGGGGAWAWAEGETRTTSGGRLGRCRRLRMRHS
jgi:hypothetical protein